VLLGGILLGLIAGLAVGGRLDNLLAIRLRWPVLLFGAVAIRFATEVAVGQDIAVAQALQLPLLLGAYLVLAAALWANRSRPGMSLALAGIVLNAIAITANGGFMPVWEPSLVAAGFDPANLPSPIHVILPPPLDLDFLLHAGPLGDVFPIPLPLVQNVASLGDVFISLGLAFFLFAGVLRTPAELAEESALAAAAGHTTVARLPRPVAVAVAELPVRPETGLSDSLTAAAAVARPVILGGSGAGVALPGLSGVPVARGRAGKAEAVGAPTLLERVRRHPYVRLAANGPFSALWAGQLISLFGDRVHQVALAFLVLGTTGSAVAVSLVFASATLPNLILGPIAGTLVDRWDQKQVMVVSDLLRAATVVIIPVAAVTSVWLVYPLVFLLTSISIFFRPARTAVLPRIVRDDELVTANSATWVAETLADVIGYPLAGLFVAFLGTALPLAFWLDAASYVVSAGLIMAVAIPPVVRATAVAAGASGVLADMRAGWRFLRAEAVLRANTLQAVVAQFSAGIIIALTPVYAERVLQGGTLDATAVYAFLETGIGVGNLVGGFFLGLVGARIAKGRLVIAGYVAYGLCVVGLALVGQVGVAIGLAFGMGVMNMVYVIPSQTLFQERTPGDMIGRVVGFRFSAVYGSMTLAMAVAGLLGEAIGVAEVIGLFGVVTVVAGLAGLLSRPLREA
jgi:DHA3 family macrolide efflux protein-like MFS transporter